MSWVNTFSVKTDMIYGHIFWDLAKIVFVSEPMGIAPFTFYHKRAITIAIYTAIVLPTLAVDSIVVKFLF